MKKHWRILALALVAVLAASTLQAAGTGSFGRYEAKSLRWVKTNSSGVLTDSAQVWIEYAAPAADGGEDTTGWVDTWQFKKPAAFAVIGDSIFAVRPMVFKFLFGGSTSDTNQVTLQYSDDGGAGTVTTLNVRSVIGHENLPVFWGDMAAIRSRYVRAIFHNTDNAAGTAAVQVSGQVYVLESD